jgi:titin
MGMGRKALGGARRAGTAVSAVAAAAMIGGCLALAAPGAAATAAPAVGGGTATPPPTRVAQIQSGTAAIERATAGAARIETHRGTELVRFVGTTRAHPIPRAGGVAAGAGPEAKARGFLASYAPMFGIDDQATQLRVTHARADAVRFQQVVGGVPVLGGELAVDLDAQGNVLAATGEATAAPKVDTTPAVGAADARAAALAVAAKQHGGDAGSVVDGPSLAVYDPTLLGGPETGAPRLVWQVTVASDGTDPFRDLVLVDARTGGVALRIESLEESKNRQVCDRNNVVGAAEACTGGYSRTEGQAATGTTDVDRAYDYAGDTYDFYASKFGRDSLDNAGLTLKSTVRFCPDASNCPYQNAYWNGAQMVYGDGFAAADDVVGHELSHGVTDFESHLFYYYQSGAINESLSDVFGEFIDQTNGSGTDTPAVKWKMGEDLPSIGAIRDMSNPPAFGDPDRMGSANYATASSDEGGVHTNSGVNNKAAFLITDGGTFNGQTITGLGIDKAARIYYETATDLMTSATDYQDLFDELQQGCQNLVGTNGITAGDCTQVTKAVTATEMNVPAPAAASATEAPVCPAGTTATNLFSDDLENTASGNWSRSIISGSTQTWAYPQNPNVFSGFDATYATSGSVNMFGGDLTTASNAAIARTANVTPPVGKTTYLRFRHAFDLEKSYDGGRVEYSTNNGSSWTDAGSLFTDGGYTASASTMGGNAFTGSSHGYYSSRIDLSSLAGQGVRFRFRLATDSSVGVYGWWIDDVRVYTCDAAPTAPGAPTIGTATRGNGQATLTWTAPASDGGSAITGYVVTPYIGAVAQPTQTFNSTATSQNVTGLTNGTSYTFTVAAKNVVGTGSPSAASNAVTPATVPGAPTIGTATAGNAQATVTWTAPASDGGSAITGYVVTPYIGAVAQSPVPFNSTATSQVVTGLTNGTTYTFTVAAVNGVGTGPESAASNAVTPSGATAPGAPTNVNGLPGNGKVTLSWTAPASNGGSSITGYVVTPYIGATAQAPTTFNTTATSQSINGLANGTTYTFTVAAKNAVGTGDPSAASGPVTAGAPSAPGFQSAQPGDQSAKVGWFAPNNNGSPITGYTITPYIGDVAQTPQTFASTATSQFVTGLTNGTTYTFTVAAINGNGTGPAATTNSVVVGAPNTPGFPRAVPGTDTARVGWASSLANGAPIQGYIVTPYVGSTPLPPTTFLGSKSVGGVVGGLTSGVTYTFTVVAYNSYGSSPEGKTSPILEGTPAQPGFQSAAPANGSARVRYTIPPSNSAPIESYTVWPVQGSTVGAPQVFNTPAATQLTVTGLTNGLSYTFRIAATNSVGMGPYATTNAVVVGAPTAPGFPSAQPGDGSAKVAWSASSDNGSAITGYTITPYIGSVAQAPQTFASTATSQVVTGLTNGTTYTFQVKATNAWGDSPISTSAAIKVGTPTAPAWPSVKPGNGAATVSWQAPAANGSPVTGYTITPYLGSAALPPQVFNSTATTQVVTGLTNGLSYTFRIAATNAVGTGPYATTAAVVVGTPSAVAKPSAVAGAGSATVTWVAPADNGSAITGYKVTPYKAGVAQAVQTFDASTTSRSITGLTPGSSYTFTVIAVNARGSSTASPASSAVVPT